MYKFYRCILLLLLPFLVRSQSFTPDPDWRFENFNSQNHFITRQVLGVASDKQGYIWTCGLGVQKFDGIKTVQFNSFNKNVHCLKENYVPQIIADNNGRIWISSAGLCYYDNAGDKFVYVQPRDSKLRIDYAFGFYLQDNYLWFVSQHGLAKINVNTLEILFTSLKIVIDPICTYPVDNHTLLISSRQTVFFYDTGKDTYTTAVLTFKNLLLKIFSVIKRNNDVYLGTNRGLFILKNTHDVTFLSDKTADLEIDDLLFMPDDKDKNYLFLATDGKGLMVYDVIKKQVELTYVHDENSLFSLPCDIIIKMFIDKHERIWIGTQYGLSMLSQHNQQWKSRYINKRNSAEQDINRIAGDMSATSRVWLAAQNIGMISLDWRTKKIEKIYNTDPEMQRTVDFTQVSANKWLLANPKKIIEWSPEKGVIAITKLPIADPVSFGYYIRRIIRTDGPDCYVTTNRGLFKYNIATRKMDVVVKSDNNEDKKHKLEYDFDNGFYDNGELWLASKHGLFNYNIATKAIKIYYGQVALDYFMHDVAKAPGNKIVCSQGDGLVIFDRKTKAFTVLNTIANVYKAACFAVICKNSKVWIASEAGLLFYDLETQKSARIEDVNSLMGIVPTCPFTQIDDEIVIAVSKGFAYFKPGMQNRIKVSNPVIESLSINNQPVLRLFSNDKLHFKYSENSVDIAFNAFLYSNPELVRFRYKLKGADKVWQYSENLRSANYAQLQPGDYTFYVQSGDKNDNWNYKLASVSFVISPPFWATWWFRAFLILLIASFLYLLYKYKINHIKAIESIRKNIASDFHDDLGSTLSSISIFSEVASQKTDTDLAGAKSMVDDIGVRARGMIHSMNDMIWTIKPENDNLYKLMQRMEEFSYPVAEAKEIRLGFVMDESLYNIKTDMVRRKNLFLIFKEAFNNAVKYSNADSIQVQFKLSSNKILVMKITDNGCGFKYDSRRPGNGLANMHKRAAEIKGKLNITTTTGKGTEINIICKIA